MEWYAPPLAGCPGVCSFTSDAHAGCPWHLSIICLPDSSISGLAHHYSQAKEARKDREQAIAKAEMAAALSKGASWGMGDDGSMSVGNDDSSGGALVDWRSYSATHVSPACSRSMMLVPSQHMHYEK